MCGLFCFFMQHFVQTSVTLRTMDPTVYMTVNVMTVLVTLSVVSVIVIQDLRAFAVRQ